MSDLFPIVPLAEQIAEAERELRQREHVYPRLVSNRTMTQAAADRHISAMQAIISTLRMIAEADVERPGT